MTASHRPNRHRPGVLHQPARKPPGETPLKLVMLLEVPLPTVAAHEPPTPPHQRRPPARHPKVADPLDPPIPHPTAAEPAIRAPRPLPRRLHLHLQAVNRIDRHTQHPNTTQPQANGHNIRHRGLLASANWYFTDFSEASPPNQGFQAPAPTYSRRANIFANATSPITRRAASRSNRNPGSGRGGPLSRGDSCCWRRSARLTPTTATVTAAAITVTVLIARPAASAVVLIAADTATDPNTAVAAPTASAARQDCAEALAAITNNSSFRVTTRSSEQCKSHHAPPAETGLSRIRPAATVGHRVTMTRGSSSDATANADAATHQPSRGGRRGANLGHLWCGTGIFS